MDEFAFHCYPNVNSDPVAKGYEWPNIGCVNFDRLKQALWDGFNGTAQPTPGEGTRFVAALGGPLQLVIDETGWQVGVSGLPGYIGAENVPVISDLVHAQYYSQLVNIAACDPSITAFHFLYFLDSPQLTDFQSGMARVDGTPRASADAVGAAIAKGCSGGRVDWKHTTKVVGAKAANGLSSSGQRAVEVSAKEDYSLAIKFSNGKKKATAIVQGKANLATDVPVPAGFAGGKAKVTFSAWANASRKSSFTIALG
jgi:hypothetical protein